MKHQAIRNLYPNAVTIEGMENPTVLDESGNLVAIDAAAVDAETAKLVAEYNALEYQRQRAVEYPAIGDQLDALFHAGVFPAEMAAAIQAVKDKYPKA